MGIEYFLGAIVIAVFLAALQTAAKKIALRKREKSEREAVQYMDEMFGLLSELEGNLERLRRLYKIKNAPPVLEKLGLNRILSSHEEFLESNMAHAKACLHLLEVDRARGIKSMKECAQESNPGIKRRISFLERTIMDIEDLIMNIP